MCGIICATVLNDMKFPPFPFRKKAQDLSKQDEKVFAEASELAQLRLEQCLADLQIWGPPVNDTPAPRGNRPLRRLPDLF